MEGRGIRNVLIKRRGIEKIIKEKKNNKVKTRV